jgi:RNA polymerase sigma factor (sigma-70 family)
MSIKTIDLEKAFEHLTGIERDVLVDRFGLFNSDKLSLHQIGTKHNVTRERIRQIEAKALRKLRQPDAVADLLQMYDDDVNE